MDMAEQVDNLFEQNPPELCILGIGSNGHIGFNEPGSALYSRSRIVSLAEPSRKNLAQRFGRIEDVPTQAIAMGIATILRAKKIILLASGEKKAEAIGKMIHGPVSILCPASFLRLHDNVEVFLDEEASKDLDNRRDYFQEEKTLLRTGEKIEGNILFCSPHPDDTSIAAGGFLFRHSASNKVKTINFYSGHRSDIPGTTLEERIKVRNSEAKEEARHLNISMHFSEFTGYDDSYRINDKDLTRLADLISTEKPRHIFLPKLDDDHPAHRACTKLLLRCLEKFPQLHQINLWFYETPWSLFKPGEANVFVALGQDEVAAKLKAIGAHRSQVARIPYDYGAEALARLRAVLAREQDLSSFGKTGPDLGKHVECFWRIQAG
jgi:LmbE family N-acetylglucosaminyl deacetylase